MQAQAHFFLELVLASSRFTHSLCLRRTCKPAFIIILHCSCASMGRVGRRGASGEEGGEWDLGTSPSHSQISSSPHSLFISSLGPNILTVSPLTIHKWSAHYPNNPLTANSPIASGVTPKFKNYIFPTFLKENMYKRGSENWYYNHLPSE